VRDQKPERLGNYRLVRLLGQGGFAEIYLGEHLRLHTPAAIKVLSSRLVGDERAQLLAEARVIARLEHPHIVRLLDFDVEDDQPFLVMQFAPHGTLRRRHPPGVCLSVEIVLSYLRQLAGALQYAHDENIIHRDMKPENVLLDRDDRLLLSDFGIAVIARNSRSLGTQEVTGTVSYMAPEQIQGKPRRASDQYALGVMVYEWLCGVPPFQGTPSEVLSQHLYAAPAPLRERLPTISPALEAVVLKALEKEAQRRFAGVQEFAEAFEHACQEASQAAATLPARRSASDSPLSAATTEPFPPAAKRGLSRRALLLGGALGLAGMLGAGTALGWLLHAPQPQAAQMLVVYTGHTASVRAVAWSPDGKLIASAGDVTVQVWDAASGLPALRVLRHPTTVNAVAWSPDGRYIASASGNSFFGGEHLVRIWETSSGAVILSYSGHAKTVNAAAWSPDGKLLASASEDKTVQVWGAATGTIVTTYTGHTDIVKALSWSPDGKLLASASNDETVQVWEAAAGTHRFSLEHASIVNTVAWSPDGKRLLSGSGNVFFQDEHLAHVWEAATGRHLLDYAEGAAVNAVSWSPDSKRAISASAEKPVHIWDAATGTTLFTYSGHTLNVNAVAWSPNGRLIASASDDGTVRVWHAPA
jgi:Tol biopolymer transport system component